MMQAKPKLFFTFLLITFLGGVLAISYFAVTQRQEVRQKAATPEGSAALILTPSAQEFSVGKTESIKVTANVADLSINGYKVVAKVSGVIPPDFTFVPSDTSSIQVVESELSDSESGTKLLTFAAVTKDSQTPIAQDGGLIPVGEFRFTPQSIGSLSISFDQALTKVTRNQSPGEDILNIPTNATFTVVESLITATPPPSTTCGNQLCEAGEADDPGGCGPNADPGCLGPPARQGTCPQDCQAGNKCLNGAMCNSGATCPAICTMSFPPQCQAGICPGPSISPTPTPSPKPTCQPRPICLDTPGSRCYPQEPPEGWCPPTPSPTPGCFYQQVECFKAPCKPILVCPTPTPICMTLPSCLNYNPPCSIPPLPPGSQYCPKPTPTPTPISNLPDLQISKISKNITNTVSGQQLVVTICNLGTGFTDQFNVNLYGPNTNTDKWSFSSQGYSTNYCAPVSLSCSVMGNVCTWSSMTALVDPENKIIESNELNNKFFTPFSTPTPTPTPSLCYYETVQCIQAPCPTPRMVCPTPRPSFTPTPTPKPINTAPQIRNRSLPDGRVGTRYSAEIIATDPDPGDIVTITTSRLPDGLRLTCNAGRPRILPNNQTTCRIEGTPKDRGTFDVRILARDSRGASTRRTFSLTIVRRRAPLPILQPLFDRLPF